MKEKEKKQEKNMLSEVLARNLARKIDSYSSRRKIRLPKGFQLIITEAKD